MSPKSYLSIQRWLLIIIGLNAVMALILLWGTIGHAVLAILDHLWLRVLLIVIAACVTGYLLRPKTLQDK